MRNFKRVIVSITALVASLATGTAFALSVDGFAGKPNNPANVSCLWGSTGGDVLNACGRQVYYLIPLAVNAGAHTVTVATYNPGGGTFTCSAIADTQFGSSITGTTVSPGTGFQQFTLDVTVPSYGTMFVGCDFNHGGRIFSVNYNQ